LTLEQKFCFFAGGGLVGLAVLLYLADKVWKFGRTRRHAAFEPPSAPTPSPQTTGPYVPGTEPEIGAAVAQRQEASG
jgi:hypothetical protein